MAMCVALNTGEGVGVDQHFENIHDAALATQLV